MKLIVEHPYYCHDNNYYSNEPRETYSSFNDFYEVWGDADIDLNLIFRFDVCPKDFDSDIEQDPKSYYANIFMILQRKGIFKPICIETFEPKDEQRMTALLEKHWEKLKELWMPISTGIK